MWGGRRKVRIHALCESLLALEILDGVKYPGVLGKEVAAATGASLTSGTLGVSNPFHPVNNKGHLADMEVIDLLEAKQTGTVGAKCGRFLGI